MNAVLEDAERLAAEGRYSEAITLLTNSNRRERKFATEQRIVELRRDGFATGALPVMPKRSFVTRVRNRLRRASGPPEISAVELTPKVLRGAILRHGSLLVRGLLPRPRVDELVEGIDRVFAAHDAWVDGAPRFETEPWFVPFEPASGVPIVRDWMREAGGVLSVDAPRVFFDLVEAFDEAGIRNLVSRYFGEPPLILASKWTLRRVSVAERGSDLKDKAPDWHQDGAFMGRDIRSLNVWVSLSHCGVDAPGLDIVTRRFEDIVETGTDGAKFDWSVGHGLVERIAPEQIVRPVFAPGDALIFDHLLLHRTAMEQHMPKVRYAIEAWFAAMSSYPVDQDQNPLLY